jgi:hypothetical protein
MRIRHSHSQFTRKCVVCGCETDSNKIYEEGGISVRVTVCSTTDCHTQVTIKGSTVSMIRSLHEEIKELRGVAQ